MSLSKLPNPPSSDSPGEHPTWPAVGYLRRVRRLLDLSQRELAQELGVSQGTIAWLESGRRPVGLETLQAALALAGLRLAVLDGDGVEVFPMSDDVVRDRAGRRFGAHLDVMLPEDERWPPHWGAGPRFDRPRNPVVVPARPGRNSRRAVAGVPTDHVTPSALDDRVTEFAAARRHAVLSRIPDRELSSWSPACECPVQCYGTGSCIDQCPCQCGG